MSTNNGKLKLLAIDDDELILCLIRDAFRSDSLEIFTASCPDEGMQFVRREHPEVILLDRVLPGVTGMELLDRIIESNPMTNVIILTGEYSPESAVEAIKKGALDYVTKPDFLPKLHDIVDDLVDEHVRAQRQLRAIDELVYHCEQEGIVGRSPLILAALDRARRIAPHFRTSLITGQTGTGKELVSRILHRMSPVSSRPFVVVNTSALVETLLESELFGHVRGAFTGATHDKIGLFEYAEGGTLFLDEIGEMSLSAQTRLLRVLQSGEIQRVGSPEVKKLDVRVIAATNRDLRALVSEGKFRDDLYYRLSVVEIHLPPLAERKEDLPLLIHHFVRNFAERFNKPELRGVSHRAQILLMRYRWPGNIRELENVLSYASMVADGHLIDVGDLPERMRALKSDDVLDDTDLVPLDVMARNYARRVVDRLGGRKGQAASVLGISRTKLYRLLRDDEKTDRHFSVVDLVSG